MEFGNPIVAGDTLIRQAIQSENFETGVSGWQINRDGTAEFQNLVARGDLTATSLDLDNGDRGRVTLAFDELNLRSEMEWFIGQQNIDDFITGGSPSGAVQTHAAGFDHRVSGGEGPLFQIGSGRFNNKAGSFIHLIGESWDSFALPDVTIGASNGGTVTFSVGNDGTVQTTTRYAGVLIEHLRHQSVKNTGPLTFVGGGGYNEEDTSMRLVVPYPRSGIVTVHMNLRGSTDTNNGILGMGVEIRDDSVTGTLRESPDADRRAEVRRDANVTMRGSWSETFTGLPTSGDMFLRAMFIGSTGINCDVNYRTITIVPSP